MKVASWTGCSVGVVFIRTNEVYLESSKLYLPEVSSACERRMNDHVRHVAVNLLRKDIRRYRESSRRKENIRREVYRTNKKRVLNSVERNDL